jgi:protein TonB
MNPDSRTASKTTGPRATFSESTIGILGKCLVDLDLPEELRARRRKQRALVLSITLESLLLATILLFPLLGKSEKISLHADILTPLPRLGAARSQPTDPHIRLTEHPCHFCKQPARIPPRTPTGDPYRTTNSDPESAPSIPGLGDPHGAAEGILNTASEPGPEPPVVVERRLVRQRISEPLEAAMLVHRVEPIYPPLAMQTHHEGRVELRAVIATDGSVQSLEVISGDSLMIQSAIAAVRQWRYRPTCLNGIPVEVDTHITVIYTMNR